MQNEIHIHMPHGICYHIIVGKPLFGMEIGRNGRKRPVSALSGKRKGSTARRAPFAEFVREIRWTREKKRGIMAKLAGLFKVPAQKERSVFRGTGS